MVHAFNPSTGEAEAGGFLSSRPAWFTEWVPGQPGLHRETLSRKTKNKFKKFKKIRHVILWFHTSIRKTVGNIHLLHNVCVWKSLKEDPRLRYYAKTKRAYCAETIIIQGSIIHWNSDLRQKHETFFIENQGNNLEYQNFHWWVLGGHRVRLLIGLSQVATGLHSYVMNF